MADSRFVMNLKGISIAFIPRIFFQRKLPNIFKEILRYKDEILEQICFRVNYYHQINQDFSEILLHSKDKEKLGQFPFKKTSKAFDAYKITKYFNDDFLIIKNYADISYKLNEPSICKDRLIGDENGIILKLDTHRHFIFLHDTQNFEDKKDLAVFRGASYQEHRKKFLQIYSGSKYCDFAHVMGNGGGVSLKLRILERIF